MREECPSRVQSADFQFLLGCYWVKKMETGISYKMDFQFLLGCYTQRQAERRIRHTKLSIPFRMLLVWAEAAKPRLTDFQFLLGCYSTPPRRIRRQLKPRLSIPFRMLRGRRSHVLYIQQFDFQFLLGCYFVALRVAGKYAYHFQFLLGCYLTILPVSTAQR